MAHSWLRAQLACLCEPLLACPRLFSPVHHGRVVFAVRVGAGRDHLDLPGLLLGAPLPLEVSQRGLQSLGFLWRVIFVWFLDLCFFNITHLFVSNLSCIIHVIFVGNLYLYLVSRVLIHTNDI